MRLLYVAITRARYCCYLGYPLYGSRSRNGQTSLGKLLGVDPQCADASSLVQQVQALPENLFALVQVTEVPVSPVTSQAQAADATRHSQCPLFGPGAKVEMLEQGVQAYTDASSAGKTELVKA